MDSNNNLTPSLCSWIRNHLVCRPPSDLDVQIYQAELVLRRHGLGQRCLDFTSPSGIPAVFVNPPTGHLFDAATWGLLQGHLEPPSRQHPLVDSQPRGVRDLPPGLPDRGTDDDPTRTASRYEHANMTKWSRVPNSISLKGYTGRQDDVTNMQTLYRHYRRFSCTLQHYLPCRMASMPKIAATTCRDQQYSARK